MEPGAVVAIVAVVAVIAAFAVNAGVRRVLADWRERAKRRFGE